MATPKKAYVELADYINRVKNTAVSGHIVGKYFTKHNLVLEDILANKEYLKFVICDLIDQPHEFVFGVADELQKLRSDHDKLKAEFDEFRERMEGSHNVKKIKVLEKTLNAVKRSNNSERVTLKRQLRQATEQVEMGNKSPEVYKRVEELSESVRVIDEDNKAIDGALAMQELEWT